MSNRLDKEREQRLQPLRMEYVCSQLEAMGFTIHFQDETRIEFIYNGHSVKFFPYSGWHTGKSIVDGRGWEKLVKQISQ